jgi:hypothetical protein
VVSEELNRLLTAQPFVPFLVRLDDGQSFEIRRQEAMWVGPLIAHIALFGSGRMLERHVTVATQYITTIEPLEALSAQSPGTN